MWSSGGLIDRSSYEGGRVVIALPVTSSILSDYPSIRIRRLFASSRLGKVTVNIPFFCVADALS